MTTQANASFAIDRWEETVVLDEPGAKFVRTVIGKSFSGDIVGTSVAEATMAHSQDGAAAYVAFERFTVTIAGRRGNFVLHHNASGTKAGRTGTWTILANSGTGDLAGIHGSATITRHDDGSHTFVLDYAFE